MVPLHSHKLIAQLQHTLAGSESSAQRNPLLIRVEVRAGHGAGKPTAKVIAETADLLGFAAECIGARWAAPPLAAAQSGGAAGAASEAAASAAAAAKPNL